MDDARVVAFQLSRVPRGRWRTVARCAHGHPSCIATAPSLEDGEPFPTLYYLTCPHLAEAVSARESAGGLAWWRDRIAADPALASALADADETYRRARSVEGGGNDPLPETGIAGQRDPQALKCLHAHVAAYLAGIADPVGAVVLEGTEVVCADRRCERALG